MAKAIKTLKSIQELSKREDFLEQLRAIGIEVGNAPQSSFITNEVEPYQRPPSIVPDYKGGNKTVSPKECAETGMRKTFVIISAGPQRVAQMHHATEIQKRGVQPGFKVEFSTIHVQGKFPNAEYNLMSVVSVDYTHASAH